MVETNYANAYKEVLIVLNNLIKDDYNKIPKEYITYLKENCNDEYEFYYDINKSFKEQKLLDDTKYILFGLFEKFGATKMQKEKIKAFKNSYYSKLEEEKRKVYNPDNIFKTKEKTSNIEDIMEKENTEMIEYKEQKWFKRLFVKILNIFKKGNRNY